MAVILFAHDWPDFQRLLTHLPFARPLEHAGKRIAQSLKGWAHAQIRIMFVIVLECTVGYWLLHIPGAGLWAVLTGMVDALPVFGTGTIFVPWLILVFCQKDYTFFVWLLLLYGITWLTRELLEPKLLGDGLGLLPVCFLISVIVGLKLFGAVGLFTGPFGILFVKELWTELEMWDSLQTPSASRCGMRKDNLICTQTKRSTCFSIFGISTDRQTRMRQLYPDLMMPPRQKTVLRSVFSPSDASTS